MADARGNHGEPADKPFLARKAQAELAGQVGVEHRRAVQVPVETVEAADIQRLTGAHARQPPLPEPGPVQSRADRSGRGTALD
jgi:hypothetical protein